VIYTFYKYQGTGNDFILLDNRAHVFPKNDSEWIRKWCDRKFGIGADGLMLLEDAEDFQFRMVYYNADGKESTMCGNGGRCICAFAKQLGIAGDTGVFSAIDGAHAFSIEGNMVSIKMIDVPVIEKDGSGYVLYTGSPHFVEFRNSIDKINIVPEARRIRYNSTYAEKGINVNFAEFKDGSVYMRTYERGVEDETLSCGTGTVAVALCAAWMQDKRNGSVDLHTPGGNLSVTFEKEGDVFTNIWLKGPAQFVYTGSIKLPETNGKDL
jgi:diaminopimelate epimerase